MTRIRSRAIGLLAALALVVGCSRKEAHPGGSETAPAPSAPPAPESTEKANRGEAANRLSQIGWGIQDFHDMQGGFPVGVVTQKGQLGLSWRVAILPALGETALYGEFKLAEPWDSEHNKKLISKMPPVFTSPGKDSGSGKTHIRAFAGPHAFVPMPAAPNAAPPALVPRTRWQSLSPGAVAVGRTADTIADGTLNTLILAEAEPVEWTKPDEIPFLDTMSWSGGPKQYPLPKLGGVYAGGFHALLGAGEVHFLPATISEASLRMLLTVDGGEVLDDATLDVLFNSKAHREKPGRPGGAPKDGVKK